MSRRFLLVAGPAAAVALAGCAADQSTVAPIDAPLAARGGAAAAALDPAAAGPGTLAAPTRFPLYAGGGSPDNPGTLVGHVLVWTNNAATIAVRYEMAAGYCISDTHLDVGTSYGDLEQTNAGNPQPGRFPFKQNSACAAVVDYPSVAASGARLLLAAHGVVQASRSTNLMSGAGLAVRTTGRRDGNATTLTEFGSLAPLAVEASMPGPAPFYSSPTVWTDALLAGSADAQWLVNSGGRWLWETRFSDQRQTIVGGTVSAVTHVGPTNLSPSRNGAVVRMEAMMSEAERRTARLRITCDNAYRVFFNGERIGADDGEVAAEGNQLSTGFVLDGPGATTSLRQNNVNTTGWQSVQAFNLDVTSGANRLTVWGINEYMDTDDEAPRILGDRITNPAGCLFGVEVRTPTGGSETAWGAPQGFGGSRNEAGNFSGSSWATYFAYTR